MGRSFLPVGDEALAAFALNFSTLLTANYASYGIDQTVATTYAQNYDTYIAALALAKQPSTRGNATVLGKNNTKIALTALTRQIARTIGNNMNVTDAQRQSLGLVIRRAKPTPIPAPTNQPTMNIVSVSVRTVNLKIHNGSARKRGKAAGAIGAKVYSFIGDGYPSDPTTWAYQGDATKSKFAITFSDSVAGGSQVWMCCAWYNRKGQTGPISVPISTNLQGGGTSSSTEPMKIAA